jgi:hypothetical protein
MTSSEEKQHDDHAAATVPATPDSGYCLGLESVNGVPSPTGAGVVRRTEWRGGAAQWSPMVECPRFAGKSSGPSAVSHCHLTAAACRERIIEARHLADLNLIALESQATILPRSSGPSTGGHTLSTGVQEITCQSPSQCSW